MNNQLRKRLAAETLGTFCLVLASTCAIVVNGGGAVSDVGVALTFGLIVFAMIAALGGSKTEIDIARLFMRRLTITGSTLRPRSVEFKAAIASRLRETVWPLLESGAIKPVIYKTFPLAQAAEAHALMESSAHIGKIMLAT